MRDGFNLPEMGRFPGMWDNQGSNVETGVGYSPWAAKESDDDLATKQPIELDNIRH